MYVWLTANVIAPIYKDNSYDIFFDKSNADFVNLVFAVRKKTTAATLRMVKSHGAILLTKINDGSIAVFQNVQVTMGVNCLCNIISI